eukprot:9434101-Pyramimonas_sp.AAC.1
MVAPLCGSMDAAVAHGSRGRKAVSMDPVIDRGQNILSIYGLVYTCCMVRALFPRGDLWRSPDPSTWVSFRSRQ